jgi:amino acid adenylation domain-containing protein
MFRDLSRVLGENADRLGPKPALTICPPAYLGAKRTDLTFEQLAGRSTAVASELAHRLRPGDRALILLPTTPEFAYSFLGCLAAGIIAVPLPPPGDESSTRRVRNVAADCSPQAILSTSAIRQYLGATVFAGRDDPLVQWVDVDDLDDTGDLSPRGVSEQDVAFLQYTSGSTTSPRGVVVSHGSLMHNEAAIQRCFGVSADSSIVSWLPLHHDMGLIGGLLQPLLTGAHALLLDPLSFLQRPASWLEAISTERAEISGGPNFAYDLCARKVTDDERANLDLSTWRLAFNGAAPVSPRTLRSFTERFREVGFRSVANTPCYGLAEATLLVASADPAQECPTRSFDPGSLEHGRAVAAGAGRELVGYDLLDHVRVRIVDPDTREAVDDGVLGEIWLSGKSNGSGYWGDGGAGSAVFDARIDGDGCAAYLRTGDVGFLHGGRLHITGRMKDLVIYRGRNLHPEDLETDVVGADAALRPGCGAIFDIDDSVVVCHEVRPDTPAEHYPDVVRSVREVLSRVYGVAAGTVALLSSGTVAKTSSGKVQRYRVKQDFLSGRLSTVWSDTTAGADATGLADAVAEVGGGSFATADPAHRIEILTGALCAHLGRLFGTGEPADRHASLASLGADSLLAVQVQHEIENLLGVTLRPSLLWRAGSLAALAEATLGPDAGPARSVGGNRPIPVPDAEEFELTEAQRALWFLQRMSPDSCAYNVTRAFALTGDVDVEHLSAALGAVVRRNVNLRLNLRAAADGHPVGRLRSEPDLRPDVVDVRSWPDDQLLDWMTSLACEPFDLDRDRLIRAAVLRRTDGWLLVLSLHHVVCDVSSLSIVLAQLAQEYTGAPAPSRGADRDRENLLLPHHLERTALAERGEQLVAYWRAQLAGNLPVLALPSTTHRRGGAGSTVSFEIPKDVASRLARFAAQAELTVHNALLATFQLLLHRLTGQADVVVGVPVAGRFDQRLDSYVGYLVNVLPIRSTVARGVAFSGFALATHQRMLDALDHCELPFAVMAQQVDIDRTTGVPPIFQAMFSYYSTTLPGGRAAAGVVLGDPGSSLDLRSASLSGHVIRDVTSQSDIALNVAELRDALHLELQYDTALLPRAQVEGFASAYRTLLGAVTADPGAEAVGLTIVDPADARDLVAAGAGPQAERDEHYLAEFGRQVRRSPEAVAADDGTAQLSYAELNGRANHVAEELLAAGVEADTTVVVCAARTVSFLAAILGIHKAGGCYVPINPAEPPLRAAQMLATLAPRAVIVDRTGRGLLDGLLAGPGPLAAARVLEMTGLARGHVERDPARRETGPHDSSYIIHTSGSTGAPKPAIVTARGLTNHLWQMIEYFGITRDDCIGQTGNALFDVSVWQFLTGLLVGARVRIVDDPHATSPAKLGAAIVDGGITLVQAVPVMISALLETRVGAEPCRLRAMISCGEELTWDIARRWLSGCPAAALYNSYGPTECADDVSIAHVGPHSDRSRPVSIGRPLTNTSVYLLDEDLELVPRGVVGSLYVGGHGVGRGYLRDPRRTAAVLRPDPFSAEPGALMYCTGDLGRLANGGELEYLGRIDRQVKMRGIRIELGEVEAALRECAGVLDAAVKVHGIDHGVLLVAYLVQEEVPADVEPSQLVAAEFQQLRAALADRLPRHMIPTNFVRLGRMPRLPNGKVDHPALTFVDAKVSDDRGTNLLDDPTGAAIASIWGELLGRDSVAPADNFFVLGGHSLLALRMIDRVGDDLSVDLEIDTVFVSPSLIEFIEAVRRAGVRRQVSTSIPRIPRTPAGARR